MSRIARFKDKSRATAELARWCQVRALLEGLGRDRIQSEGGTLVKTQSSSPFRSRGSSVPRYAPTNPRISLLYSEKLSGHGKKGSTRKHGATVAKQALPEGDDGRGDRLLLQGLF